MEETIAELIRFETSILTDKLTVALLAYLFWFSFLIFYMLRKMWELEEELEDRDVHLSEQMHELSKKFTILVEGDWQEEEEPEYEQK